MPVNTNTDGCVHVHMAGTQELWFSSYTTQENHINFRGQNIFYLFRKVTVTVNAIDIAVLSETYFCPVLQPFMLNIKTLQIYFQDSFFVILH